MKELNIGINGFGRIGRSIFRNIEDISRLKIVRINDINPDIDNIAYTINYDSTYGRSKNKYTTSGKNLVHAGSSFSALISHEAEIDRADWTGIDILCSHVYTHETNIIPQYNCGGLSWSHAPSDWMDRSHQLD